MKTTEQLKISVAENHCYKNGVLGNAWDLAMQITHITKSQIQLYEELLSETIKQFENKLRWIPVEEKVPENNKIVEAKLKKDGHPIFFSYKHENKKWYISNLVLGNVEFLLTDSIPVEWRYFL